MVRDIKLSDYWSLGLRTLWMCWEDIGSWATPRDWNSVGLKWALGGVLFFFLASLQMMLILLSIEAHLDQQGPPVGSGGMEEERQIKNSFNALDNTMAEQLALLQKHRRRSSVLCRPPAGRRWYLTCTLKNEELPRQKRERISANEVAGTRCRVHLRTRERVIWTELEAERSDHRSIEEQPAASIWKSLSLPSKVPGILFCSGEQWSCSNIVCGPSSMP